MAWTQTELDLIETAIAKGERLVRFADRTVEYRSINELLSARDAIKAELNKASLSKRPRAYRARTCKGL